MLLLFFAGLAATAYMYNHVPTAFVPQEDQSYFLIIVQTPPGASLSYTSEFADRVAAEVRKNDGVFGTFSVMGFSLAGGSSPNSGLIFAPLKPIDDRDQDGPGIHRARYRRSKSDRNSSASPAASPSPQSPQPSPASAPSAASSSSFRTAAATPSATSTASPTPSSAQAARRAPASPA